YLRLPVWIVIGLTGRVPPDPAWFSRHFGRRFPPFLLLDDVAGLPEEFARISFRHFADLYVRAFVFQSLGESERIESWDRDRWATFQEVIRWILDDSRPETVFPQRASVNGVVARLIEPYSRKLGEAELDWLKKALL